MSGRVGAPRRVRCHVDIMLAKERYRRRDRDPRHLGNRRADAELWGAEVAPLGVGPLLDVNTSGPLAARIRSVLATWVDRAGAGPRELDKPGRADRGSSG